MAQRGSGNRKAPRPSGNGENNSFNQNKQMELAVVDDIINYNSSVIFILESPHTNEVAGGIPLLGDSGIIFSRALMSDIETPAGLQIKQGNAPFSVMNTFQNALQLNSELSSLNNAIKNLDFEEIGFFKYKKSVRNLIKENLHAISLIDII